MAPLTKSARDYFRALGKRHGASGGAKAAANMTPEERQARARKASEAAVLARRRKAGRA
jgi:hypothetical protein